MCICAGSITFAALYCVLVFLLLVFPWAAAPGHRPMPSFSVTAYCHSPPRRLAGRPALAAAAYTRLGHMCWDFPCLPMLYRATMVQKIVDYFVPVAIWNPISTTWKTCSRKPFYYWGALMDVIYSHRTISCMQPVPFWCQRV